MSCSNGKFAANPRMADALVVAKIYTSLYEMKLPAEMDQPPAAWRIVWSGRAFGERTLAQAVLEKVRVAAKSLPPDNALG